MILTNVMITLKFFPGFQNFIFLLVKELITYTQIHKSLWIMITQTVCPSASHVGSTHLKLIFDYAGWVLKAHPEDGLKVRRG